MNQPVNLQKIKSFSQLQYCSISKKPAFCSTYIAKSSRKVLFSIQPYHLHHDRQSQIMKNISTKCCRSIFYTLFKTPATISSWYLASLIESPGKFAKIISQNYPSANCSIAVLVISQHFAQPILPNVLEKNHFSIQPYHLRHQRQRQNMKTIFCCSIFFIGFDPKLPRLLSETRFAKLFLFEVITTLIMKSQAFLPIPNSNTTKKVLQYKGAPSKQFKMPAFFPSLY